MLRLALTAALLFPLVGAGCATAQSPSDPAPPSPSSESRDTLDLDLRQSATVGAHTVRFAEVVEDSRCPPDVQCITQGVARIRIEIDGESFVLTVPGGRTGAGDTDTAERNGLTVTVTAFSPVDAEPVRATLAVSGG